MKPLTQYLICLVFMVVFGASGAALLFIETAYAIDPMFVFTPWLFWTGLGLFAAGVIFFVSAICVKGVRF